MTSLLRPLAVGEILDGAFALYRRHFVLLVLTAAAVFVPLGLIGMVVPLLGFMGSILAPFLINGALIWAASEFIHEREITMGAALKVGLKRLVPLAIMSLAYGLIVSIGFVLLIIPGLMALVYFFAYQQIVVIERRLNFLDRSVSLVKGGFWKCTAVVLIATIIVALPSIILAVGSLTLTEQLQTEVITFGWQQLAQFGLSCLTLPFTALVTTLLYYERRVTVEGLDVARSAETLERSIRAAQ